MIDAFFWLVLPVALLEGARIARFEYKGGERTLAHALAYGALEFVLLAGCAATASPLTFLAFAGGRIGVARLREGRLWGPGLLKTVLVAAAMILLVGVGDVDSFAGLAGSALGDATRHGILALVCAACLVAIMPVHVADEQRETLVAPLAFIAFARVAIPLGAEEPWFRLVVPVVAAFLGLVCALWLMSAGKRANHFEPAALVSELLLCERGVVLSFVWLGLAAGAPLAGIGALLQWWSGALSLLALEASLRRRPLPRSMAFFALAMAVCLPGTVGFIAEDLLAHGLLELRPWLAAAFVGVTAINATALYLTLVHILADLGEPEDLQPRPSLTMLSAAALSLLIGLLPQSFVSVATAAHAVIAPRTALVEPVEHERDGAQAPAGPSRAT
jgi:hypothetical protein